MQRDVPLSALESPLPRYFFQVGGAVSRSDPDGVELDDPTQAWAEALQYANDLKAELDCVSEHNAWHILVTGPDGSFVFRLDFKASS